MKEELVTLLSIKLSEHIRECVCEFLTEHFSPDAIEDTSDIINLLMSAHLNSMICTTETVAMDLDSGPILVIEFNKKLLEFIGTLRPIKSVEIRRKQ